MSQRTCSMSTDTVAPRMDTEAVNMTDKQHYVNMPKRRRSSGPAPLAFVASSGDSLYALRLDSDP